MTDMLGSSLIFDDISLSNESSSSNALNIGLKSNPIESRIELFMNSSVNITERTYQIVLYAGKY